MTEAEKINKAINQALARIAPIVGFAPEDAATTRLGGLTNLVFRVDVGDQSYCLRIPGEGTEAYIDRRVEKINTHAAAESGVSPRVLFFDESDGLMLADFVLDAVTMTSRGFAARAGAPARAGRALRRLHGSGVKFEFTFELFSMIKGYLAEIEKLGVAPPPGYDDTVREADEVRAALQAWPLPNAPCHCDPLCENFLDDGEEMRIVDWEYSGKNDPMWDLGDLSVEGEFNEARDEEMLRAYFDCEARPYDRGRMILYKAMCDLLWTLWGLIQLGNNNPAEDFAEYARQRFARCRALMASSDFSRHLRAVRVGPEARKV